MDKGIIESFGPYGLQKKFTEISQSINNLSTGIVTNYALYILIGLLFFFNIAFISKHIDINYLIVLVLVSVISLPYISKVEHINSQILIKSGIIEMFHLIEETASRLPEFKALFDSFDSQTSAYSEQDINTVIEGRLKCQDLAHRFYKEAYENLKDGRIENRIVAQQATELENTKEVDLLRNN